MVKSVSLSWKVLSASSRLRFRDDCMSRAARGLKRELKENTVSAEKRSGGASFAKITSRTSSCVRAEREWSSRKKQRLCREKKRCDRLERKTSFLGVAELLREFRGEERSTSTQRTAPRPWPRCSRPPRLRNHPRRYLRRRRCVMATRARRRLLPVPRT